MATPVTWQSRFQINTGSAETGTQSTPKIIGLDNGNVVVVWIEDASGAVSGSAGGNLIAKVFDSEGNVVTDATPLTTSFSGLDETDFDVAATNDAGFVIAFVGQDVSTPNNSSLIHARFNAGLNLVSSGALESETTAAEGYDEVSIAYNHQNNGSIVTFTKAEAGGDTEIYAYSVAGSGVSGAAINISNSGSPNANSDVAILSDGNFLTVFEAVTGDNYIWSRVSQPDGTSVSGVSGPQSPNTLATPSTASFNGGGHVVAFQVDINPTVFVTSDNAAFLNTQQLSVDDDSTGPATNTQVIVLPDGDFVVAWIDGGEDTALRARRYNPDRSEDGDIIDVSLSDSGSEPVGVSDYHMSVSADGRILFSWIEVASGEVFVTVFDPRGDTIEMSEFQTGTTNFIETFDAVARREGGTINGDANDNILVGLEGVDLLFGAGGNDRLSGGLNADTLEGGAGEDTLLGGAGHDTLNGGGNDDYLAGDDGDNSASLPGNDDMSGGDGDDTMVGDAGNDTMSGDAGEDEMWGGRGNDTLNGGDDDDFLVGDNGDNSSSLRGRDNMSGGGGNDTMFGDAGNDTLNGGDGADDLNGDTGNDLLVGGNGKDRLLGGVGNDTIRGGDGKDKLFGEGGNDNMSGGSGNDNLAGGGGKDKLLGGVGGDKLIAGRGNDVLDGGKDKDQLISGGGKDKLVFKKGYGKDKALDFQDNRDTIQFSKQLWKGKMDVQEVLETFASMKGNDVVFKFSKKDVFTVKKIGDVDSLVDDIVIV